MKRIRAREMGIAPGIFPTGPKNSLTDVSGVLVGHTTIHKGSGPHVPGEGPIRTGVTAILPRQGNVWQNAVAAGSFILNGAGEMSGLIQVQEWGLIESPILLTNTHSVGTCSEAVVSHLSSIYPKLGISHDVLIPLVGECDDSWLNDIVGQHVDTNHVIEAITNANSKMVPEGSVGSGTGMSCFDFKSGIGSSSRIVKIGLEKYTLGALVMSNFGEIQDLIVDGIPMGKMLMQDYAHLEKRTRNAGSIITIIATDAPLHGFQLNRLAKRAALGIGRTGSYAAHGSGEIIVAFSTANELPREGRDTVYSLKVMVDQEVNPLYQAVVEATEEAILNSLFMAEDFYGIGDRFCPAIPLDKVGPIYEDFRALRKKFESH